MKEKKRENQNDGKICHNFLTPKEKAKWLRNRRKDERPNARER